MAYLRFTRDTRGYENTYLVHTSALHGKPQSRILYWFRTPPNVRVGRVALDEGAVRLIEELHPEIEFDWPQILKTTIPAAPAAPFDGFRKPRRPGGPGQGQGQGQGRGGKVREAGPAEPPVAPPALEAPTGPAGDSRVEAQGGRKRSRRGNRRRGRGADNPASPAAVGSPSEAVSADADADDQDPSSIV